MAYVDFTNLYKLSLYKIDRYSIYLYIYRFYNKDLQLINEEKYIYSINHFEYQFNDLSYTDILVHFCIQTSNYNYLAQYYKLRQNYKSEIYQLKYKNRTVTCQYNKPIINCNIKYVNQLDNLIKSYLLLKELC